MGDYNYGALAASQKLMARMFEPAKPAPPPEPVIEASAWCHSLAEARIVRACLSIMLPKCQVICYENIYMLSYRIVAYTVKP